MIHGDAMNQATRRGQQPRHTGLSDLGRAFDFCAPPASVCTRLPTLLLCCVVGWSRPAFVPAGVLSSSLLLDTTLFQLSTLHIDYLAPTLCGLAPGAELARRGAR